MNIYSELTLRTLKHLSTLLWCFYRRFRIYFWQYREVMTLILGLLNWLFPMICVILLSNFLEENECIDSFYVFLFTCGCNLPLKVFHPILEWILLSYLYRVPQAFLRSIGLASDKNIEGCQSYTDCCPKLSFSIGFTRATLENIQLILLIWSLYFSRAANSIF